MNDRFWSKVDKAGNCWLWTAATRPNGYGCIRVQGRLESAHRIAYELANGKIPDNLVVMHRCDTRLCVRPDHLSLGTSRDNTLDAIGKMRHHLAPGSGKLTIADVRAIRALYSTSLYGYGRLGKEFSLNKKTVAEIIKGKIWRSTDTNSDTNPDQHAATSVKMAA